MNMMIGEFTNTIYGRGGADILAFDYAPVKELPAKPEIGTYTADHLSKWNRRLKKPIALMKLTSFPVGDYLVVVISLK